LILHKDYIKLYKDTITEREHTTRFVFKNISSDLRVSKLLTSK